ncbi:MAG: PAS domain-containing protein [Candidatus Fermentibacteraceae bacterium]|nr:PAS domain-containing protein [Candidatus Fermentibacteraceae bacterium]
MRNGNAGAPASRGWLIIRWNPESGVSLVSGDSEGLLGVSARRLLRSPEPLGLLPTDISTVLASGLPDVPVHLATATLTGSVSTVDEHAEIILFGIPGLQSRSDVMLDELGAGIVGTDRAGVITLWNKSMSSIFRIPQKHVIGKNIQDVLVSPVLYSWENVIKMVLEGKQIKVVCRPDAQRRIECTVTLGGNGVVGTCFDTTESYQAENRLRTSRKMNQAYFHSVSTGLVLFDKDYRILVANRAFGRMFGLVENLLGIHLHEILPSESYEIIEDQTRPFFTSNTLEKEDGRTAHFVLPDRTRRVILQDVHPIVEDSGEVFYAVGIFEDISEITLLRENYGSYVDTVRKLNSLSDLLQSGRSLSTAEISERVLDCLAAGAVAIFLSDPITDNRLSGSTSGWPESAPEVFSELRLAPVLVETDSGYRLTGEDLGVISSSFSSCLVFPLESERKSYGYLIVAYSGNEPSADIFPLAELASRMVRSHFSAGEYETEIEHLDLLNSRQGDLVGRIIDSLDVPVAIFRLDWSVIVWNRPMEELTGVSVDLASGRPELAANILFNGIGGVSAAQKLLRNGSSEFPESWEVENQDGGTARCTWRLTRTESVEGRNLEPVVIIAGVKSDDVFSINAARSAAETYSALSRGTSALLAASDRTRVEEAAAAALLEISGASRVTVKIRGIKPVTRTSYDLKPEETISYWTLPLETETELVGECQFHGGKEYSVMKDFARNMARTCIELEKSAIGRRFAFLAERAAGKFFISNSSGRLLLSTWMDITDGVISNRTIYDMFSGTDWSVIDSVMSGLRNKGRLNMKLKTADGDEVQMAAVALDGHQGETLFIWWPVSDPAYKKHLMRQEVALDSGRALREMLDSLLESIGSSFVKVREVLNPDHPVASVLNTSLYAFEGIEKGHVYLRMIQMSLNTVPERVSTEEYLDSVMAAFIESGRATPDITISGNLYDISGRMDLMTETTLRLCGIVCPESAPAFNVSVVRRKSLETDEALPRGPEQFVRIDVRRVDGGQLKNLPGTICDFEAPWDFSAGITPHAEINLLCLVLMLAGGSLGRSSQKGTLQLLFPCMD